MAPYDKSDFCFMWLVQWQLNKQKKKQHKGVFVLSILQNSASCNFLIMYEKNWQGIKEHGLIVYAVSNIFLGIQP